VGSVLDDIGGCQTNIERFQIRLDQPSEADYDAVDGWLRWAVSVSRQTGQTSPEGSTVVHGRISTYNMANSRRLVSVSGGWSVENAGHREFIAYATKTQPAECIHVPDFRLYVYI